MNKEYTLYIVHHSHTDIGYTELQERIVYSHCRYIHDAIHLIKEGYANNTLYKHFKWNCETYFCVEKFFEESNADEQELFFQYVGSGNIGISANYLNFTDLVDTYILNKRVVEMCDIFLKKGITISTAMTADINGLSLGNWDVFINNGIKFLYTNIHCHHGMYPLYQNQNAYFWENKKSQRILVWNGEHYNLGNALNLVCSPHANYMTKHYFGDIHSKDPIDLLEKNIQQYITQCEKSQYPYNFIPVSVSGVFSDNAPPNSDILMNIDIFNKRENGIVLKMVTLQELYENIKDALSDVPVYGGDINDWWAHGVASTPYSVKHYREAQRMYHICRKLDPQQEYSDTTVLREAENNALLFAEHTWGHSASISDPYDTTVLNLDIRNTSYASKTHEATAKILNRIMHNKYGDILQYYYRSGIITAVHVANTKMLCLVHFYIEVYHYGDIELREKSTGNKIKTQIVTTPRGIDVYFVYEFDAHERKDFVYKEIPKQNQRINMRYAYIGSEGVKDIVNNYDRSYQLQYALENNYFRIEYKNGKGVHSFYNKIQNKEMLVSGEKCFFTPIYERTSLRHTPYEERRLLGRNIRGKHAQLFLGNLSDVHILDQGNIFNKVELVYTLEGTHHSSVIITLYNHEARIDFSFRIAKHVSEDIESIYLPLTLNRENASLYIDKGNALFRPGIDQVPGTCMEYYLVNNGLIYRDAEYSIAINTLDAPMLYAGELKHHPIHLCDNKAENNKRPLYSWVMNNLWETNFKLDLSGFAEFSYSLFMFPAQEKIEDDLVYMQDKSYGAQTCITGQ